VRDLQTKILKIKELRDEFTLNDTLNPYDVLDLSKDPFINWEEKGKGEFCIGDPESVK